MGHSKKILITGGSGLLGSNIARTAAGEFETYATYLSRQSRIDGCRFIPLDIRDRRQALSVLSDVKPDLVIHTAGLVNVDYCEDHAEEAAALNVTGTENIAQAAQKTGAKFIYISTDSVFDGQKGMYSETDATNPLTTYARTKLEGERRTQQILPDSLIVRTAFYGWSLHEERSLAEWVLTGLRAKRRLRMWHDAFFSPIPANTLAELLLAIYRQNISGIFHAGGSERCSKFDFGKAVARAFGLDETLIEPATVDAAGLRAARPKDVSLDTTKLAAALGYPPPGVSEGIASFKNTEP